MLAAGSGRRFGMPKALVDTGAGAWVTRALDAVRGCDPRVVVIGAAADQVAALLPGDVLAIHNDAYEIGMGSSLRVGLLALADFGVSSSRSKSAPSADPGLIDAALITLVDLPGVGRAVIDRVRAAAGSASAARGAILRASFAGVPGHPVLLGRDHWPGVIEGAVGDRGARDYLATHSAELVECGDIGSGQDVDTPEQG